MVDIIHGNQHPFYVKRSPRGAVVVCRAHFVTDEIKPEEAEALVTALNTQHQKWMSR